MSFNWHHTRVMWKITGGSRVIAPFKGYAAFLLIHHYLLPVVCFIFFYGRWENNERLIPIPETRPRNQPHTPVLAQPMGSVSDPLGPTLLHLGPDSFPKTSHTIKMACFESNLWMKRTKRVSLQYKTHNSYILSTIYGALHWNEKVNSSECINVVLFWTYFEVPKILLWNSFECFAKLMAKC